MAITTVDKVKINKYLKEHSVDELNYLEMCDTIGKRGKISDIEFLDYFTECVIFEFRKSTKISIKHVIKFASLVEKFLFRLNNDNIEISDITLDKIRNFKELYNEYLKRNNFEIDEEFGDSWLDFVLETIDELYPAENATEPTSIYINLVEDLNEKIKSLEKELSSATKSYKKLQDSYECKLEEVETLKNNFGSLLHESTTKDKMISELNEEITSLNRKISELEVQLSKLQDENSALGMYKEQCEILSNKTEELLSKVKDLLEIIDNDLLAKKMAADLEKKHSDIESLIYQKLLFERVTIDELLAYIQVHGFVSNKDEIAALLKSIKSKIQIDSSFFSTSPTYKIITPKVLEDGNFSIHIPFGQKHYDIMLVSDFHIKEVNQKVLNGFDILNDYCVKNNIHLILNLGDFYDGFSSKPLDYNNAINNYSVIEQSISLIPKVDGLYHAILGGNHDRNIVSYGFDPLEILANEREDFINLGYIHSIVSLCNSSNVVGMFDIHHPDTFDFPINLDEDGISMGDMDNYLSDVYRKLGRNRDESYIDIFGHTHRSQFNYPGSYCYIPSYLEGKSKKGACHLRIYFDEDTNIKYMVFMPLSFNTKLVKNNELIYQKILSK